MEKLEMCRVCLVENVRMYVVDNKSLQELYEKLTNVPFVTEDSRPMLACYFCCTKLKQCWRFQRKCLEAEELFAQMLNEDYEPNPSINLSHLEFFSGFVKTPIETIDIFDVGQTESMAIKGEVPDDCEKLFDIFEPKEEHLSEDLGNSYSDVDIPLHNPEIDVQDDRPLIEVKIEVVEDKEVSQKKTKRSFVGVAQKPRLDIRRAKLKDTITEEQNKQPNYKLTRNTQDRTYTNTKLRVNNSINNIALDTNCYNNNYNKKDLRCDLWKNKGIDGDYTNRYQSLGNKERPYTCDICQRNFSTKYILAVHIRTHTGEKPYKCELCQSSFTQFGDLNRHILIHTGEKPFKCDVCQRRFNHKGHLTRHILKHTGEKPYKCDICQRCFNTKGNLIRHNRTHSGEKPFNCDICESRYNDKRDLLKHIRIHTGEKPFKCEICELSFNDKRDLSKHIHKHTGKIPKKNKCNICQRSFIYRSDLQKHILIHTGEKPYKCDICQRSFNIKGNLNRHIRIHTDE